MKRTYVLGVIVIAGAVAAAAANLRRAAAAGGGRTRPPAAGRGGGPALGKIEKVADNLYFIFGAGGNTASTWRRRASSWSTPRTRTTDRASSTR